MIRKYDANHLIFSDRYIEYHFPESVVYEALPYVDGIAIQPKNQLSFDFLEGVYKKYKRPIFIADHVTSYATEEYANSMAQVADNVDDYLKFCCSSVNEVMSQAYIIGYNKCQYIEQYRKGDAHLKFFFANKDLAANTSVHIDLKRHDFTWGAVLRDIFASSPYAHIYKKNFLTYFNGVGFGIEMKPKWRTQGKEDVLLYQNDYQIISAISSWALNYTKPGYSALGRPAIYRELLDKQLALGAPIEGIGFQSRLKHGLITPDTIYKRLCDFDRFNLPYQATEFEIREDTSKYVYSESKRRILTEYMMVMYFSHPRVTGFWHWTFTLYDERGNSFQHSR